MKALALEYVVQWIILLTVAMIVISMVIYFSEDIKRLLRMKTQETKIEPRDIKKEEPFSSGEILTYAFSCWEKIGEKCRGEAVCFYLFGNFTSVDKNWVLEQFSQRYPEGRPKIDLTNFDTSKDYAKVRFRELDCAVVVEN
jgi:hypothetical protein